jgi:predicted DNA-binding transcriptional regulator YafY
LDTGDLIDAVRAHRAVELLYRTRAGVDARVVHPHAVYRTSSGDLRLDGVQVSGFTRSGPLPGWRAFELMKIADVRVLDVRFEPASDFDSGSSKYRHGLLAAA